MGETLQILTSYSPYSAEPQTSPSALLWVSLEKGLLSVFWTGLALGMPRTEFFKIQVVADALGKQTPLCLPYCLPRVTE